MPNKETAKTKLVPRRLIASLLLVAACGLLFAVAGTVATPTTRLSVGGRVFTLQIADSKEARMHGLGGRQSLPADEGMVLEYRGSIIRCIWMRDMQFPLDIVWLNSAKRVVHIETDVSPRTYPHQFCPHTPARYVIELNAGTVQTTHMSTGQTLKF